MFVFQRDQHWSVELKFFFDFLPQLWFKGELRCALFFLNIATFLFFVCCPSLTDSLYIHTCSINIQICEDQVDQIKHTQNRERTNRFLSFPDLILHFFSWSFCLELFLFYTIPYLNPWCMHWRTHFNSFRLSKFAKWKCLKSFSSTQTWTERTVAQSAFPPLLHIWPYVRWQMRKGERARTCETLPDPYWERAVKKPFASLREDMNPQGTASSSYSIRYEEFCCSCVGEALICLPLHQFYSLKIVQNHKYVWWVSFSSSFSPRCWHQMGSGGAPTWLVYVCLYWYGPPADRDQSLLNKPLNVALNGGSQRSIIGSVLLKIALHRQHAKSDRLIRPAAFLLLRKCHVFVQNSSLYWLQICGIDWSVSPAPLICYLSHPPSQQ